MLETDTTPPIISELYEIIFQAPAYVLVLETLLIALIVWIIFHKQQNNEKILSETKLDYFFRNWKPEPLTPEVDKNHSLSKNHIIDGIVGKHVTVDGIKCLNMATHNYLGLEEYPQIIENAIKCVQHLGIGSCGPRMFYGTAEVHLKLEARLAKFMDRDNSIVGSHAFSTIACILPAYSKINDIIFADECVYFPIQNGIDASRSRVVYFKHNDMKDLEKKLKEQHQFDMKNPRKAAKIRRFLVVEGIYVNTGEMCPLGELVKLRKKYKLRLFLDETISFGTVGEHGRGVTELLCVDKNEIDLISGTLENSIGSVGNFTVGAYLIIEYLRGAGLAHLFSASLPPFLAQAAFSALDVFENEPNIFLQLNDVAKKLDEQFRHFSKMELRGHPLSPVKHLYVRDEKESAECERMLRKIAEECIKRGLAVVYAEYLSAEKFAPRRSLRITINRLFTDDEIKTAFKILEQVSISVIPD